jgi:hypothetical protein
MIRTCVENAGVSTLSDTNVGSGSDVDLSACLRIVAPIAARGAGDIDRLFETQAL